MKESKYNYCQKDYTGLLIYNAKSDEIIALNPQLADIYEKETPEGIRNLHPELYSYLTERGVFIEEDADEVNSVRFRLSCIGNRTTSLCCMI